MSGSNFLSDGGDYGAQYSAFSRFVPTGLADSKQSYTFNPEGAIDGAHIASNPPKPNSGSVKLESKYTGFPAMVISALSAFGAIKATRNHPAPVTGTVDGGVTLGVVPPQTVPLENSAGSVLDFYNNLDASGGGNRTNAPKDNNAISGVYIR